MATRRGVKDVTLLDASESGGTLVMDPPTAVELAMRRSDAPPPPVPSPAAHPADPILVIAELAKDQAVDVVKLDKIIASFERLAAHKARAEFDAAFAEMQPHLPEIDESGRIIVKGEFRSSYAKNEDIQKAIKPVLGRFGFALRFQNDRVSDGKKLRTLAILSHRAGHRETDEFIADPDDSGSKNAIQANGSTRSYGQRYTTISILNISTREKSHRDDDGQTSQPAAAPSDPDGYAEWAKQLTAAAGQGGKVFYPFWNQSPQALRQHMTKHHPDDWKALKARAGGEAQS